jgi:DNA-binding winged helix-turn-helix (wHTH) protein/tetratricopeptide (TPR) repeat protein
MAFVFDEFILDLDKRELRNGQTPLKLEPQAFNLLHYLIVRRDRVVGRDELIETIWQGRIVSDAALATRINSVRRALGDTGKTQRLIRTVSRNGFRFVAAVQEVTGPADRSGAGSPVPRRAPPPNQASDRVPVAVFPFAAVTGHREERWFGEALASELVIALSRYQWFPILAPIPMIDAAGSLGWERRSWQSSLRYVVRGTVRRRGAVLRVTAHLIEAFSGTNLWGDVFEAALDEGFSWQDGIIGTIAGSIEPQLRVAEAYRAVQADQHATPYQLHLRAHPIFSDGKESVSRSLRLLERALVLDPVYAPALADAANCLQVLDINVVGRDRLADRRNAIAFARRALQIADEPEPIATAAFALAYFGENMDEALALLHHALKLNPHFARGWYMYGMALLYAGQPEQALESLQNSLRLNPRDRLGRRNNFGVGLAEFFMGHDDAAIVNRSYGSFRAGRRLTPPSPRAMPGRARRRTLSALPSG